MRKIYRLGAALAVVAMFAVTVRSAEASMVEAPYSTFNYDKWGNAVPAPNGYLPTREIKGGDIGCGAFRDPQDMFVFQETREVFIADSGNNRIVIVDFEGMLTGIIDSFSYKGAPYEINTPAGLFVTAGGELYICDQGNGAVIRCGRDGVITAVYGKPESSLITQSFEYRPSKVAVDSYGKIYVQALGVFEGIFSLDAGGGFINYFGANHVDMTFGLYMQQIWKRYFTFSLEQRRAMRSAVPIEYSNIFIDGENFIYATVTTTADTDISLEDTKQDIYKANNRELVRKLNPLGANIINKLNMNWFQHAAFTDITVNAEGVMTMCDSVLGVIYQCDKYGKLMFAFGGLGGQLGLFSSPAAIAETDGNLWVLDRAKRNITVFEPTEFGQTVHTAMQLYNDGRYQENIEPWEEVIRSDANYLLAYTGLGKAYFQLEEYERAMDYFRLANDRSGYSEAFAEYSLIFMRAHFGWFFAAVLLCAALWFLLPGLRALDRKRKEGKRS